MDGEILSHWDQQEAFRFAQELRKLVVTDGIDTTVLTTIIPIIQWLDKVSWLGAER